MRLEKYDVILASGSPRRKELLEMLGIKFRVEKVDVEESFPKGLSGEKIVMHIAKQKGDAWNLKDNELVITADTIVWLNGHVYGKPKDEEDAKRMLRELSGNTHQVFTGVQIRTAEKTTTFADKTDVTFKKLSEDEIEHYVKEYRPLDKAGAYGIQEWIGYVGISKIKGSYWNVMGLPVQKVWEELENITRKL